MGDEDNDSRTPLQGRSPRGCGCLLLVLITLALYCLSIGPVIRYYNRRLPHELEVFYGPLAYITEKFPPASALLNFYLKFWLPPIPAPPTPANKPASPSSTN